MHRAAVRNLQQLGPLLLGQYPAELDPQLDPVEQGVPRLAVGAIGRVASLVTKPYRDVAQRPFLPSRIQRDGHGGSGSPISCAKPCALP